MIPNSLEENKIERDKWKEYMNDCSGHVCLHISCIILSSEIKTIVQRDFIIIVVAFFVSQVLSKDEQMFIYLSLFLFVHMQGCDYAYHISIEHYWKRKKSRAF